MGTPSPKQDRPFFRSQSGRLDLPHRSLSHHERAGLDPADSAAGILYSHESAHIVQLPPPPPNTARAVSNPLPLPPDLDYPVDAIETLPWTSVSETTVASGRLVIEKVKGSTNFLKSGKVMHGIMRNSQCWCVDGESKFVLRYGKFQYYRIELPSNTDEEKAKIAQFRDVLKKILRFEATPCPFKRGFHVELPESAITPRRRGTWKKRESSFTPTSVSLRPNGSTAASRWAARMANRNSQEAKNDTDRREVETDSSDDQALESTFKNKEDHDERLSLSAVADKHNELSGRFSPSSDDEGSVDDNGLSQLASKDARSGPASPADDMDVRNPADAVDEKRASEVVDDRKEARDANEREELEEVETPKDADEQKEANYVDELNEAEVLDVSKGAHGADKGNRAKDVDESEKDEEVMDDLQEANDVDQPIEAEDVDKSKEAGVLDDSEGMDDVEEPNGANYVEKSNEAEVHDVRREADDVDKRNEAAFMNAQKMMGDVENPEEANTIENPQKSDEMDERESYNVDEPEGDNLDEQKDPDALKELREIDAAGTTFDGIPSVVDIESEQNRVQSLEGPESDPQLEPEAEFEQISETQAIEPDSDLKPDISNAFLPEPRNKDTSAFLFSDPPSISRGLSSSGSDSESTETNNDDVEDDQQQDDHLADPENFTSENISLVSSVTSFHSLAPLDSRDSSSSRSYGLPYDEQPHSPVGIVEKLDSPRNRAQHYQEGDFELNVSATPSGAEYNSEENPSLNRPSTSTSDRPSTPILAGSSASDSSWPDVQTPSGPHNDADLRRRRKVRRSLSPLTSCAVISPTPQQSQHSPTVILYKAGSLALRKPIELVVMLVHIMVRVAAGATVNDLLSGDLFRHPDQEREQKSNRNLPDQLDERRDDNWEEDDFGFSLKRRRTGSVDGKPLDDADSLD